MPAKLNVGASQKVADGHYGSRGASVNLEIELDSTLAMDPAKLRDCIRRLFGLVRQSLAEELKSPNAGTQLPSDGGNQPAADSAATNVKPSGGVRSATLAQVKALLAIAKEQHLDLLDVLRERYGVERPQELLLKQASELIDALKATRAAKAA